jgi:nucleoid DNA-binding protein
LPLITTREVLVVIENMIEMMAEVLVSSKRVELELL